MAVKLEGPIRRYLGTSADTKPTIGAQADGLVITAADLPAGSSFLESDTGLIYRWDGSDWKVAPPDWRIELLLMSIDERLARLVEIAEEGL